MPRRAAEVIDLGENPPSNLNSAFAGAGAPPALDSRWAKAGLVVGPRRRRRSLLVAASSRIDFLGVNPLFDDHLTHASTHTESLWLTRWAREV